MSPDHPSQLGRYQVLEVLGRGAMGVVYLAQDPALNRLVALKTFHVGGDVEDRDRHQFRERFLREAKSCGMLNHPNVVTVHDVVEIEDDSAFMAMEYVRGTNLKQLIQGGERFEPGFLISVVEQIAAGLDYAHSRGVIHRDVKPANILLTPDSVAKITDFGIARFNASNLTHAGQLLGTPNYMAPEQILGVDVDHRADLFSLGVLVYELLTRRKPFQGDNLTMVTHRIVYEDFEPPEQFVKNFPAELKAVLTKALAKEPGDRYLDATALARELRRALEGAPSPDALSGAAATVPPAPKGPEPPRPEPQKPEPQKPEAGGEETQGDIPRSPPPLIPPPPSGEDTQPSLVSLPPPLPGEPSQWRQQLDGVLDQTRNLARKALPPEARPPRRRVAAYAAAGVVLLVLGLVVAALAHRRVEPGLTDSLEAERMEWASAFSSRMVAGAQELERGAPVSAVDRFEEARQMLDSRRGFLESLRDELLAKGEESAARALEADLEGLESLESTSAEALERAEWQRERDRFQTLRFQASGETLEAARQALQSGRRTRARAELRRALELDPGNEEALQLLGEVRGRRAPLPDQLADRSPPPPPPPPDLPALAVEPPPPAPKQAVVDRDATLTVRMISDLPRGVLLIYLDEDQLLRENFRFGEKGGLFRRSKAETGIFRQRFTVAPGDHALRVYVSGARNRPTESRLLNGNFPPGSSNRLEIRVSAEGEVRAVLR